MTRLRWSTAGESHGAGVLAFIEGIPAGVPLDSPRIDALLMRRQSGLGRGKRMEIEQDRVEILSGLKRGATLGSPITMLVRNKDHRIDGYRKLSRPRPGHADFAGAIKYGTVDCADVMERASARETVGRTAAGGVAAQVLELLGVRVFGWVSAIGPIGFEGFPLDLRSAELTRDSSNCASLDAEADRRAESLIADLQARGETVGGRIRVIAVGVPCGLGSPMQWDLRLDGRLAAACMSIPAIKAFELGAGVESARILGTEFHDPIVSPAPEVRRPSNRAGGIDAGMTNGQQLDLTLTMKPIPSVKHGLQSVDLETGVPSLSNYERSDVCSVPRAAVVAEAVVCLVLLEALLEKTGGDELSEVKRNLDSYRNQGLPRGR